MMKKGLTIIELVVAMGIFSIIALVAVGAFITVAKTRSLTGNIRESQQKIRLAEETITRLSRQAYFVRTGPGNPSSWVELFFLDEPGTNLTAYKYEIVSGNPGQLELKSSICLDPTILPTNPTCEAITPNPAYDTQQDLLSGAVYLEAGSGFIKNSSGIIPKMDIILKGKITGLVPGQYYDDTFHVITSVLLEGIR